MMAAAIFVSVRQNENRYGALVQRLVKYVRKDLFGIYLIHGVYLYILKIPVVRTTIDTALMIPLLSLFIFVLSLYTTKLVRKIWGINRFVE